MSLDLSQPNAGNSCSSKREGTKNIFFKSSMSVINHYSFSDPQNGDTCAAPLKATQAQHREVSIERREWEKESIEKRGAAISRFFAFKVMPNIFINWAEQTYTTNIQNKKRLNPNRWTKSGILWIKHIFCFLKQVFIWQAIFAKANTETNKKGEFLISSQNGSRSGDFLKQSGKA